MGAGTGDCGAVAGTESAVTGSAVDDDSMPPALTSSGARQSSTTPKIVSMAQRRVLLTVGRSMCHRATASASPAPARDGPRVRITIQSRKTAPQRAAATAAKIIVKNWSTLRGGMINAVAAAGSVYAFRCLPRNYIAHNRFQILRGGGVP